MGSVSPSGKPWHGIGEFGQPKKGEVRWGGVEWSGVAGIRFDYIVHLYVHRLALG